MSPYEQVDKSIWSDPDRATFEALRAAPRVRLFMESPEEVLVWLFSRGDRYAELKEKLCAQMCRHPENRLQILETAGAFVSTEYPKGWLPPRRPGPYRKPPRPRKEPIAARVAYYGGLCWICRVAPWEHIEHVKPKSKGGSDLPANLRPACKACNWAKGNKWPYVRPELV